LGHQLFQSSFLLLEPNKGFLRLSITTQIAHAHTHTYIKRQSKVIIIIQEINRTYGKRDTNRITDKRICFFAIPRPHQIKVDKVKDY
jgi:hypothetical protein